MEEWTKPNGESSLDLCLQQAIRKTRIAYWRGLRHPDWIWRRRDWIRRRRQDDFYDPLRGACHFDAKYDLVGEPHPGLGDMVRIPVMFATPDDPFQKDGKVGLIGM